MSKIKFPSGLVSGETALLGLQTTTILLCSQMVFPLCTCVCGGARYLVPLPLFIRTLVLLDWGSTMITSSNFNYLLKCPMSKCTLGVRASIYELGVGSAKRSDLWATARDDLRPSVQQLTKNWMPQTANEWAWKQILSQLSLEVRPQRGQHLDYRLERDCETEDTGKSCQDSWWTETTRW